MTMTRHYRTFQQTFAPGESAKVPGLARYVRCIESTAPFNIGIDDAPVAYFDQGLGFELPDGQTFQSVRIVNTSAGANAIILGLGLGHMQDSRASFTTAIDLSKSAALTSGNDIVVTALAVALVAPANSSRRKLFVSAPAGNVVALRIGPFSVGFGGQGAELLPGQTIEIATAADVYVYNPGAYGQIVSFFGVND